jgi:hypothetical protein
MLTSTGLRASALIAVAGTALVLLPAVAPAQPAVPRMTLRQLVTPSSRLEAHGRPLRFALHGLIEFDTLADLFAHVDAEAGRWRFESPAARQAFGDALLRRGVESRVVSMETELPLELLLTHTPAELEAATGTAAGGSTVFRGRHWQLSADVYREAFLRVRDRWSRSLNCWSAAPSIPARVLSNWYVIDEGITLYGASYDSTEHFWQAVKFHPEVSVGELRTLLESMATVDWRPWLDALATDQAFYFANTYAVEFLKRNLHRERLAWYHDELGRVAPATPARTAQQRGARPSGAPLIFTPFQEKVLWGDLADVFHLVVAFAGRPGVPVPAAVTAARDALVARQFDAVYLAGYGNGRMPFLSPEFQALMLEIWKVKFLQMPRFGDVIRRTAGMRLDHFLNDGDSPDIPIPIYIGQLNRIRDLALEIRP